MTDINTGYFLQPMKRQVSTDNGVTWQDTGEIRIDSILNETLCPLTPPTFSRYISFAVSNLDAANITAYDLNNTPLTGVTATFINSVSGRYEKAGWSDWTQPPPPEVVFLPSGQRQLWRLDGLTTALPSIYLNFFNTQFANIDSSGNLPQWLDLANVDGNTDTGFAFKWQYLSEIEDFIPQHLYFF